MAWTHYNDFSPHARNGRLCSICGLDADERGVWDTGINIDFEGQFQICARCAEELADALGWATPERTAVLTQAWDWAEHRATDLRAQLDVKEQALQLLAKDVANTARDRASALAEGYDQAVAELTDPEPQP